MKRKNPETSLEAYRSLDPNNLAEIYSKILFALKNLSSATSEQIADAIRVPHPRVWRRMGELETVGLVYRPGHTLKNKSGRSAAVWCLKTESTQKEQHPTPVIGIRQYSDAIERIKQQTLF